MMLCITYDRSYIITVIKYTISPLICTCCVSILSTNLRNFTMPMTVDDLLYNNLARMHRCQHFIYHFIWRVLLPPYPSASWLHHHQLHGVSSACHQTLLSDMNWWHGSWSATVCSCRALMQQVGTTQVLTRAKNDSAVSKIGVAGRSQVAG